MTNTTKLIAKLAVAIGLIGSVAFSAATPALAAANVGTHYYEPGDTGTVWSYYPGYTDKSTAQRPANRTTALDARAQAPAFSHRGAAAVDDPPGSRFQDEGNNESMGCPC